MPGLVMLGVLAQIQGEMRERIIADLERWEGVAVFPVAKEFYIGILIERPTLEGALASLSTEVASAPGILATWPVFSHDDLAERLSEKGSDPFSDTD